MRNGTDCGICAGIFNLTDKLPLVVCRHNHTLCLFCCKALLRTGSDRCPYCRYIILFSHLKANSTIVASIKERMRRVDGNSIEYDGNSIEYDGADNVGGGREQLASNDA